MKLDYVHVQKPDETSALQPPEIDLSTISAGEDGTVSEDYLSQIALARYEEIFFFVREELRKIGKDGMLPE